MKSVPNRRSWNAVRREAFEALRDVRWCAYCRKDGNEKYGPDNRPWAIDHVIPSFKGGTDRLENLVKCCHQCNSRKHTSTEPRWQPASDVPTAAGVLYGEVFPDRSGTAYETKALPEALKLADAEIKYLRLLLQNEKQKVFELEKYVFNASKALADIKLIANYAAPNFDVAYRPYETGETK
jgi:hypothetical protein